MVAPIVDSIVNIFCIAASRISVTLNFYRRSHEGLLSFFRRTIIRRISNRLILFFTLCLFAWCNVISRFLILFFFHESLCLPFDLFETLELRASRKTCAWNTINKIVLSFSFSLTNSRSIKKINAILKYEQDQTILINFLPSLKTNPQMKLFCHVTFFS